MRKRPCAAAGRLRFAFTAIDSAAMRRWTLRLVCLALMLATLPAGAVPVHAQDPVSYILGRINDLRASHGLNTLGVNGQLTAAAQGHANYLASTAYIHPHRERDGSLPQDRAARAGYGGRVGENVVGGQSASPEWAFNWWMQSPAHYNNMLAEWTEVGIAYTDGGQYGRWYVTVFGNMGREIRVGEGVTGGAGTAVPGGAPARPPSTPRPTVPPTLTFTPSVTLTPSLTFTPRPTSTSSPTWTAQPPTETPIVLEISPQPMTETPTPESENLNAPPTPTAGPVEAAMVASLPPVEAAPAESSANVSAGIGAGFSVRDLIPWALGLQVVVIGGLVLSALFRRRR
ncbi:MAG: hypothetical protein IT323_16580 [Anaerolineae bacterium]|nr:hypothetical protein [Anaerolineae bacterium]